MLRLAVLALALAVPAAAQVTVDAERGAAHRSVGVYVPSTVSPGGAATFGFRLAYEQAPPPGAAESELQRDVAFYLALRARPGAGLGPVGSIEVGNPFLELFLPDTKVSLGLGLRAGPVAAHVEGFGALDIIRERFYTGLRFGVSAPF